jgi:serralysin
MPITASYNLAQFRLTVNGDGADDFIGITRDGPGALYVNNGTVPISGGPATKVLFLGVFGGDGNDTLTLFNTPSAMPQADLYGGDGADILIGGSGIDTLIGGAGADRLDGGGNTDTLEGGAGDDWYFISDSLDVLVEAEGEGNDRIFATGGFELYNGVHVETLSTTDSAGTVAASFLGNNFANALIGNAGHNILDGAGGADTLYGYGGDDWFYVDSGGDLVFEAAGMGTDRVFARASYALPAGAHVELLTTDNIYATTAIDLTGNQFVNSIVGNAGNNTLNGGGGVDTLNGQGGNDRYIVDNAAEVVIELAGNGSDRVLAGVHFTLAAGLSVETLSTTDDTGTLALRLTGNELVNAIIGNAGDNRLDGAGGADTMYGYGGHDTYVVDSISDVVIEGINNGNDRVLASVSYSLGGGREVEMLSTTDVAGTTAINLAGNEFDNTVVGNAGNNTLKGGGGTDWLHGHAGDDWFYVDTAADSVFETVGNGNDRVFTSVSYTLGGGQRVETLSTTDSAGTAAIHLTGNEQVNTLIGNAGNNVLDGGGAADTMYGLGGDDRFYAWSADDVVIEGPGGGTDRIFTFHSYTLATGSHVEVLSSLDTAGGSAASLIGNEFANTILANAGDNTLDGGGGSDALYGYGGADSFRFSTALGAGNVDTIVSFVVADDTIQLDDAVFAGLALGALASDAFHTGMVAVAVTQRIIYDDLSGKLWFDADGTGAGAAIQFATVQAGLMITAADFLVV